VQTRRSHIVEDLDNLELKGKKLTKTLDGLSKINRWLGNTKHTLKAVQEQFQKHNIQTIVDLGCGGGDNLIEVAKWCEAQNKNVKLIGIDGNQHCLEHAKSKSDCEIEFRQADILHPDFEIPKCDLLISSHFIYHFKDDDLISFLKKAERKVTIAMIFSELKRNAKAHALFRVFGKFFGKAVCSDGLKAIERSFTIDEVFDLMDEAEMLNISIESKPWFRYIAVIQLAS
jgi:2-polyprenyl-3-methyl-5-hydroxy-6-metoxy-1,4-benzoquinol methylase